MTDTCDGINSEGDSCGLPAGWGTDSENYCRYHEDQASVVTGEIELSTVNGLDEITDDDPDVVAIQGDETLYAEYGGVYLPVVGAAFLVRTPDDTESTHNND